MNYLVLVNKNNLIKESYFKDLELVECKNDDGDIIKVEKETYSAYLELKKYLDSINIDVVIGSAFRSIEEQQKIIDDFTKEHGEEYVKNYVAPIRTSEHHTGLALDLVLLVEEDENLEGLTETEKFQRKMKMEKETKNKKDPVDRIGRKVTTQVENTLIRKSVNKIINGLFK